LNETERKRKNKRNINQSQGYKKYISGKKIQKSENESKKQGA
jgi:hypothetical protein